MIVSHKPGTKIVLVEEAFNRITGEEANQKYVRQMARKYMDTVLTEPYELWIDVDVADEAGVFIYHIESTPQNHFTKGEK
jgi:hypothetical protein